ncbi:MAG: class I SAM-dependent methyltransferase [Bacteroidota bacterium]|nr:class I SAM-dependent methyltransferase [Bacteroidota bacterium]
MKRIVQQAAFRAQDILVRPLIHREVRRLRQIENECAKKIAQSVEETFSTKLTPEEAMHIESIERIRTSLLRSDERILMTDYGAGAKNGAENKTRIVGDVAVQSSKPFRWALLLFKLIRTLKPNTCLELGTCLGISGMYQAAALMLNGKGTLVTMEGAESYASIAKKNFSESGYKNAEVVVGRFRDTLDATLNRMPSIDYAFIDGHHDGNATIGYFNTLSPHLSKNAVVLFDDIHWSTGMTRAWTTLCNDQRTLLHSDLRQLGIIITQ